MTTHEWRLERVGEHFVLVQRNGDAVDRYPLPNANVLTLAGDMHHALTGLVINVMGCRPNAKADLTRS